MIERYPLLSSRRLLALYAHPDDETLISGTLARYASEGVEVTLVCATRGEVGEISDPALATAETLGTVREGELRCATKAIGINDPIFLNYRDSGMIGTQENQHADAFMNAVAADVVAKLVAIIRDRQPQVVVTFDETGGYGHPDHIAIWRHAHAAVEAAADKSYGGGDRGPWQVSRIVYGMFPRSMFARMREILVANEQDVTELDAFLDRGLGTDDDQIHIVTDVSAFMDRKTAARDCHRTQFGGENFFSRVGEAEMRRMMSNEHFSIGWPTPAPGTREADLFPS